MTSYCFACLGAREYYVARFTSDGAIRYDLTPCRQCCASSQRAVEETETAAPFSNPERER